MMDPIKGWLKSKTVIFNGLAALVLLAEQFMEIIPEGTNMEMMVAVIAAVNVVLRFATSQGVELTKPMGKPSE